MNVLFKNATIVDPNGPYHNQTLDILVENGVISQIEKDITNTSAQEIVLDNLKVSSGWFDSSVSFGEPGYEERETIANGLEVAAKSGFTSVAINSNCQPYIDSKSIVTFLKNNALGAEVTIHPIGSLTKASKGIDIAELYDMQQAGAIAFGDYKKSISNANLMKVAIQYAQNFDGLILSYPNTQSISGEGIANEGIHSTRLGLRGIPALAEELQISRDLFLLEYTGGKLHIPTISTAKSVALIKAAKEKGLQVTCSVTADHLTLNDEELSKFDANYKIAPPLRTATDVEALIAGVLDNTIDCITSDHNPIDIENKKLEFAHALDGSIGLESLFVSLVDKLPLDILIEKISTTPKQIFGIVHSPITVGKTANLSLFSTEPEGVFTESMIHSTSKNSAFIGKTTKGKVYGIYNNNSLVLA